MGSALLHVERLSMISSCAHFMEICAMLVGLVEVVLMSVWRLD